MVKKLTPLWAVLTSPSTKTATERSEEPVCDLRYSRGYSGDTRRGFKEAEAKELAGWMCDGWTASMMKPLSSASKVKFSTLCTLPGLRISEAVNLLKKASSGSLSTLSRHQICRNCASTSNSQSPAPVVRGLIAQSQFSRFHARSFVAVERVKSRLANKVLSQCSPKAQLRPYNQI